MIDLVLELVEVIQQVQAALSSGCLYIFNNKLVIIMYILNKFDTRSRHHLHFTTCSNVVAACQNNIFATKLVHIT